MGSYPPKTATMVISPSVQWQTHISHTDTSYNEMGTIAILNIIYQNRQTQSWYTPYVILDKYDTWHRPY